MALIDQRRLALSGAARAHPLHAPLWRLPGVDRAGGHIRPPRSVPAGLSAAAARRGAAVPSRDPDRYMASGSDRRDADRANAIAAACDHERRQLEAWGERPRPTRPRRRGAGDARSPHDVLRALELGGGKVPEQMGSSRGPREVHPLLLHAPGAGAEPPRQRRRRRLRRRWAASWAQAGPLTRLPCRDRRSIQGERADHRRLQ
jgi:hypothetical protein